jgi:hypothetical protein
MTKSGKREVKSTCFSHEESARENPSQCTRISGSPLPSSAPKLPEAGPVNMELATQSL